MKKDLKYLSLLVILFIIFLVVELLTPRDTDWTPTLSKDHKIPFGTYILYEMLPDIFPDQQFSHLNLTLFEIQKLNEKVSPNIFVLASEFAPGKEDTQALLSMVHGGGNAFISTYQFKNLFADTLNTNTSFDFSPDLNPTNKGLKINFTSANNLEGSFAFQRDHIPYYFSSYDSAATVILADDENDNPIFVKTSFGKGAFYLSTTPLAYTNYYILHQNNHEFVEKTLSFLPLKDIIWTNYYQFGRIESQSPIRYILSQTSLKWAYFLTVGLLIVYLVIETKRKQRAIPVVKPPINSTRQFIETVSNLYFQKAQHKNIAQKQITYFLQKVRSHYYLSTDELDHEFVQKLTHKTGKREEDIEKIIQYIKWTSVQNAISPEDLMRLNQYLHSFKW